MTSGKFKYRKKEHVDDIKYNRKTTALAKLYQEKTIQINFNEINTFFLSGLYYPSIITETIDGLTCKNPICNDAAFNLPQLWFELLSSYENRNKHPSKIK